MNELTTLKSSSTTSLSAIDTLRTRIASLETSNREALAVLDSKTSTNAELSDELQKQHQKNVKLNQEIASLQQSVQAAQATSTSAKFREQALQQELELARRNNEWFENELKTKSSEALKYRKEKGARIAELQRLNEEANSNIDSLTRTEQQLRSRLDGAQQKADEALSKVQQLQEAAARTEEGFRAELESAKRLVELKEQQTETHRQRLKEVELRLEQVKDEGAGEVRRVRQELEQVKEELSEADQRSQNLEAEIDRLQALLSTQAPPGSAPQTPRPNGSAFRPASPFGTPASIRGKSAITAAQAMEELYKTKAELAGERRRNQQLSQEIDEIMSALEAKGPEIDDLQEEAERLRNESVEMTRLADESFQERDAAKKAAKKAEAANRKAEAEVQILRTQLRDLSTQIQLLIFNMHARERGYEQLTEEEAHQFQRLQNGQVSDGALEDMSDTHQFITERFVAFKDIQELQAKNQELLRVTRELAQKMESEEAAAAKQQAAEDQKELAGLREKAAGLQDELNSSMVRMKSYMTERDMFRRMLQQKASVAEIHSVLGQSADGSHREVLASIEQSSAVDDGDLTVALRELQNNFDSYRNEQSIDRQTMREQLEKLSAERNSLQAEIAKLSSQITLASERYEMLHSNFAALQSENKELQKRNQTVSESAARQDIRTQQVAEDLVEARGLLESLRSENANLRAEKTLWQGIQQRLNNDNESLVQEKARLNSLLTSQQTLQNERDLSESETKRRLQSQIDNLEAELTATKRKLADEVDEAKKLQLRKEYDAQQAQQRIDDLMAMVSQNKEELVATKTSRDHLQARVDELTIELRNAEERSQRLQPRPTPRAPAPASQPDMDEDLAARVQELEDEAADLKRDLELAKSQLDTAKAQAQSFKELAQSTEEDLNGMNEAQEQYRQEMDAALVEKDAKIKELAQRVEDLSAELANSNNQLTALQDSRAELARKFEDEKQILESDIARLKDQEDRYKEEKKWHQSDLRAQADIAAKAQQSYEEELVKHAEAAKAVQTLRAEYNQLRTEAASWRAEAESAKLSLSQSESSWEDRKQQFERELVEVKARRDDAGAQIKLLHQQLESVTAQIAGLQQSRASAGDAGPGTPSAVADTTLESLRELNSYLRREKEISEVQLELKVQESNRLKQKLEYAQSQLDEARLKLEQERRSQADSTRSSLTHKELMDKLNELNLIRESNVTLRSETQQAQEQLRQKIAKVKELEGKIQPLEARVAELENQKVFMEEEMKQLSEDRERWQKRTEGILTKYGRVDPAEMEQLKQTISALEAERDTLKQSEQPLAQKVQEVEATLESERNQWKETRNKIVEQAKNKAREQTATIRDLTTQKNELQQQASSATDKLASTEKDLEAVTTQKSALEAQVQALQQQQQQAQVSSVDSATANAVQPDTGAEQAAQLQQELGSVRAELETVRSQKASIEQELQGLRLQLESAVAERDEAIAHAQSQVVNGGDTVMQNGVQAEQSHALPAHLSDAERKELEEKIAALEAKAEDAERKAQDVEDNMQNILKERSDKMKNILNQRLKDSKEKQEQEFQESKQKLQDEFNLRIAQEKQIWLAEQSATPGSQTAAPATPAKPSDAQPPPTPTSALPLDFSRLGDAETRDLLANNQTVKNIVAANIKKKVDMETKKVREEVEQNIKSEYEAKITGARENGQMMAEKKASLRINMAENKLRAANAKIDVVATAAKETPERPVGEVWTVAKDAKPTAATPAPAAAPATSASTPGKRDNRQPP